MTFIASDACRQDMALSAAAEKAGKIHRVVLMIDLGDLREGIFFENREAVFAAAEQVEADPWLELLGAAFNLTCYGSVLPSVENLSVFLGLVREMEERIGRRLSFVSGGNSSSLPLLLSGEMPGGVTNLRLGEAVALGRETAYGQALEGLFQDAVCLEAELVEVQTEPSYPVGEIGVNAFGERGSYVDLGPRRRAIAAMVEDPAADLMLSGQLKEGGKLQVLAQDERVQVRLV